MITFNEIVNTFDIVGKKHLMINSFHSGFLDEVDINKLGAKDYVILYIEPSTVNINTGVLTYSFTIYVMDIASEDIGSSSEDNRTQRKGRNDTWSETLNILQDVVNEFKQNLYASSWVEDQIVLQMPINAEPYTARFNNLLTGWSAQLTLEVNNHNNLCISPIAPNS